MRTDKGFRGNEPAEVDFSHKYMMSRGERSNGERLAGAFIEKAPAKFSRSCEDNKRVAVLKQWVRAGRVALPTRCIHQRAAIALFLRHSRPA
jgi:hypothetical protein